MSASDGSIVGAVKIIDQGPDAQRYVVAILGDGYQAAELPTFATDAQTFVAKLLATPPFDQLGAAINVYRVDVSSTDSGADNPAACGGDGSTARTYFDATFCSSGTGAINQRILTVNSALATQVAASNAPNLKVTFVLVNSAIYGGSGDSANHVAVLSKAPASADIGIHELGHAGFGLADEYEATGNNAGGNVYSGPEPAEPNVTTVQDAATIKWSALLTAGVAVPTTANADCSQNSPAVSPVPAASVGSFVGAKYAHCGCYRPQFACKMRTLTDPFCAVCANEIVRKIQPLVRGMPTISAISPTSGDLAGGTVVTITGASLTGSTQVAFGANNAVTFGIRDDNTIVAVAPAGIGSVQVEVDNPQGCAVLAGVRFTYSAPQAPPTVTGVAPTTGPTAGGANVVITGSGFTGAATIAFGSAVATTFTIDSDSQITVTSPASSASSAGTVDVTVAGPTGTSSASAADRFTFAVPAPVVTGVSPANGPAAGGSAVTVSGSGFTGATQVMFGTAAGTAVAVVSDTQITTTSPAGSGAVDVTVVTPSGASAAVAADQFTYIAAPAVTAVAPAGGLPVGGTAVTITGTGLAGATSVLFGTAAAVFSQVSDVSITATSPAGTGAVDVTVTTAAGVSATSPADLFTYSGGPQVTGLTPASGTDAGGDTVVIAGAGFTGATTVMFGDTAATQFNVDSDGQITATSPAGTGTVDVTVTGPSGVSGVGSADRFTYTGAPTVTGLAPTSGDGAGGDSVVITGSGFTDATGVSFGANAATPFTVDSDGQITATSPAGGGAVDVTVTTPVGTSATGPADLFTYTTPALPGVTSLSPSAGSSAGGDQVTITGIGFTGATSVNFDAAGAFFTVDSDVSITATTPAGTGTVNVTVVTPNGTSPTGPTDQFTYI